MLVIFKLPVSRRVRLLLGLLLLGGVAWLGVWTHWVYVQRRFEVVSEGQVFRSAAMPPDELVEVVREHGIKTVIDFRKPKNYKTEIQAEHDAMADIGVRHVNLPTGQVPDDPRVVQRFLELIGDPKNRPALIHCQHGLGRAVLFAGVYRIEIDGWDNDRARRASRFITWGSGFSASSSKGKYLLDYVPRNKRESP